MNKYNKTLDLKDDENCPRALDVESNNHRRKKKGQS